LIEINFTFLIQAVNFFVLIFLLNVVLYKPILKVLEERDERVAGQQAEAKKIMEEGQALLSEYNQKLYNAKVEAMNAKNAARSQASEEAGRIIEEARKKAEDIVAEVQRQISVEIERAKKELEPDLVSMAATIAEKVLGRKVA
jgi:F-type H+-transporting ATPase subunit b